jgi:hypothetical protein
VRLKKPEAMDFERPTEFVHRERPIAIWSPGRHEATRQLTSFEGHDVDLISHRKVQQGDPCLTQRRPFLKVLPDER